MAKAVREEYYCEKHGFRTTDPRRAVDHIKGDMVDVVFEGAAKVVKASLGLK
jgi:hypothetical protein